MFSQFKRALVIDDLRNLKPKALPAHLHIDIARNSQEAIALIKSHTYDLIFWDHDLGGDDTSRKVAMHLLEEAMNNENLPPLFNVIHTDNPVGGEWLEGTLNSRFFTQNKTMRVSSDEFFVVEQV